MLEFNGKQIKGIDLLEKFNLKGKYNAITKNPIFNVNAVLKSIPVAEGKVNKRKPQGDEILCRFTYWDEKELVTNEVRYYKTKVNKTIGGVTKDVYTPKVVDMDSSFFVAYGDADLAIFAYLAPSCKDSPLFKPGNAYIYSFDDREKAADEKIEKYSKITKVGERLGRIADEELLITAMGFNLSNANNMSKKELLAAITEYAYTNQDNFLMRMQSLELGFEGRIRMALAKGIFERKDMHNIATYYWGSGKKKGQMVHQCPLGETEPERAFIIYVTEHPEMFYDELMKASQEAVAKNNIESFLQSKQNPENMPSIIAKDPSIDLSTVVDSATAKLFLASRHPEGKVTSVTRIKEFAEMVVNGVINEDNLEDTIIGYFPKAETV